VHVRLSRSRGEQSDGELQIMPSDKKAVFDLLKDRAMKLVTDAA